MSQLRLDRFLADMGAGTRSEIKKLIKAGRVRVDGSAASSPDAHVDPEVNAVELDGTRLEYTRYRYFMMDKPAGVLTASRDKNAPTVIDLLPDELKRLGLFPVGRLDKDTTGLLLLTNDGDFAHRVISPSKCVTKRYHAVTDGVCTEADVKAFAAGIVLADGTECLPAVLEISGTDVCFVSVMEGKYHQVKRMLASVGKPVLELRRLSVGGLVLEEMSPGGICELSQEQKDLVFEKNSEK